MWHIFCRVIDNFGDAGFALRLSRQLSVQFSQKVSLWIDKPPLLSKMLGNEKIPNFSVFSWEDNHFELQNNDIVIELFSCHLPEFALAKIEQTRTHFLWIALDYLGLEPWVIDFHLKESPQKNHTKYFYFPGFFQNTGGVIAENQTLPCPFDTQKPLSINVFLYDDSPIGILKKYPLHFLGKNNFLEQRVFDAALDGAALNLVRGEDSFVRAIFAGQPFVWQAYRQKKNAHFKKVQAFLSIFAPFLNPKIQNDVLDFFYFINTMKSNFSPESLLSINNFKIWQENARDFAQHLLKEKSLAEHLIDFVKFKKMES